VFLADHPRPTTRQVTGGGPPPQLLRDPGQPLGAAPDYILGSAHAVTDSGEIVVGSGSGSQLGAYAYAADHVILVIGHQKLVRDLDEGLRRLREYSLPREFARMQAAGFPGSVLAKTLVLHHERGDRTMVILVPETLGF